MIADLLTSAVPVASDILERTASTPRVQQIVSLSLAPAFLLAAIGIKHPRSPRKRFWHRRERKRD